MRDTTQWSSSGTSLQAEVVTCSDHRRRHLPATAGEVAGRLMDSPEATSSSTSLRICTRMGTLHSLILSDPENNPKTEVV